MLDLINTVYESKKEVMSTVQRRANEMNFAVSTKRSNGRSIYIQCIHGGVYRNTHNIQSSDRKRKKTTKKTGCGWLLSASMASKKKLWIIRSVSDINAHNHPLVEGVYQVTNIYKTEEIEALRHHILKSTTEEGKEGAVISNAEYTKQFYSDRAKESDQKETQVENTEGDQTVVEVNTAIQRDPILVKNTVEENTVHQIESGPC
ncbi:hypothetical protein G6F56_010517 [Rhizopus delemar]|nr:hypothetical protein G6F56_010517 [Rhizopus delemar]